MTRTATSEQRLAVLGYLLYALGVLFGITAVIGAIISHCKIGSVEARSTRRHLLAQMGSFWLVAILLAGAIWQWPTPYATALATTAIGIWLVTCLAGFWLLRPLHTSD